MYRLLLVLLMGGPLWLPAQQIDRTEDAVYRLTDAGFLQTYKDYRAETEEYVALFKAKAREENYDPEEIIRMKSAYRRTSEAFEDFIYAIRNDLLDPRKRKAIRKNTEAYVTGQLERLQQIHETYFLGRFHETYVAIVERESYNTIATVDPTGEQPSPNREASNPINPTIPIALIAPVTRATMDVIEYLDKKKERDMAQVKRILEQEWINPHRFRDWEDI